MKKTVIWIVLISSLIFLAAGCSKLKNKVVKDISNQSPIVYLVNVPPDESRYSVNPRVYWFGTDPDGYITKYQYLVIPEVVFDESSDDSLGLIPKVNGFIDSSFVEDIESISVDNWSPDFISSFLSSRSYSSIPDYHISADSMIVMDSVGSEENVRLFAELDTIKWVSQYIFIRAVDNEEGTSKIWKSAQQGGHVFRKFSRNNHPPKAHIPPPEEPIPYLSGYFVHQGETLGSFLETFSLPETTETWKGFELTWLGSDSSDYPRKQPDFQFKWELMGPFENSAEVIAARTTNQSVIDSSFDSTTGSRWTWGQSKLLTNLRNYNEDGGGTLGWYLFRLRSKDDALVESEDTAFCFLKVIHPHFTYSPGNRILLVDASIFNSFEPPIFKVSEAEERREIYKNYLQSIQAEVGFDSFDIWYDSSYALIQMRPPPDRHLMSLYDLIIVINYGGNSGIEGGGILFPGAPGNTPPDYGYMAYTYYLDVGGKVWFIGINNFGLPSGVAPRGFNMMDPTSMTSGFFGRAEVVVRAQEYFGIQGVGFPKWEFNVSGTNEEFIAAEPFLGAEAFPILETDSARLDTFVWWDQTNIDKGLINPQCWSAIPGVNYERISIQAQRIYSFVSFIGPLSEMHGKPCGARFKGITYKTAEFCFPLCMMKDNQAREAMRLMLVWFFE